MSRPTLPLAILAIACGLAVGAAPAHAAQKRQTWVSAGGTDAGLCPISAPCATFQYAHNRTVNGGTLSVLSSGDYGPLAVNRAISIVAEGVEAKITTGKNGSGITVNAAADAAVSLRGLTVDMRGTSTTGISFNSGATLNLDRMVIRNVTGALYFHPTAGTSRLNVVDTLIENVVEAGGISISPEGTAVVSFVLDRIKVAQCAGPGVALYGAAGTMTGILHESTIAGSDNVGAVVGGTGGGTVTLTLDQAALVGNDTGLLVTGATAIARIGNSTVIGNGTGMTADGGGAIESYGSNQVYGNTVTDGAPTSTIGTI